ncbi:MAG: hypothetical protein BWZ01_02028 [Deltaproteobacteria bacterium ADurb.BinA179]|nr:MAG: hypothetical protein BWZ01_02028 [Deltaproteobacteria bacterium ADurb.BinA179]
MNERMHVEKILELGREDHGGHGEDAAGNGLSHDEDVGLHAGLLEEEPAPRPPEPALCLVEDELRAVPVAQGPDLGVICLFRFPAPVLRLYGLHDKGRGPAAHGGFRRLCIAEGNGLHTRDQLSELFLVLPGGQAQREARLAVAAAVDCDELGSLSIAPCELARRFHGFAPGHPEKHAAQVSGNEIRDPSREQGLLLGRQHEVALVCLEKGLFEPRGDNRVPPAEVEYTGRCVAVETTVAVRVKNIRSFAGGLKEIAPPAADLFHQAFREHPLRCCKKDVLFRLLC